MQMMSMVCFLKSISREKKAKIPYPVKAGGWDLMFFKHKNLFWMLAILPLSIMALTESCSKMKSKTGSLNEFYSSDENICSAAYEPSPGLNAKSTSENVALLPFEQKKVQLDTVLLQKTSASLHQQPVIAIIDRQCSPAPNSLSEQILQSQPNPLKNLSRIAVPFTIQNFLDLTTLEKLAENDPCLLGLSSPGQLRTAALALPDVNDTHLNKQNHLAFTNYKHAYNYLIKGQSSSSLTQVAFIDSGIDCNHSDLQGQLPINCGDNFVNDLLPPDDEPSGHGTHVAGLLGAVVNNAIGTAGIAGRGVRLYPIKVIGPDGGSVQDAYDAIQRAIILSVDVINLSIQSDTQLTVVEQAVAEAVRAGIVVVMAAGNFGKELGVDAMTSPGLIGQTLNGAITVGSVDVNYGGLSRFSNFGDKVEIATTGAVDSFTGVNGGLYSLAPNNSYQRMMGTSQSTPLVSGAAALVIQFLKQNNINYSPADIERIILNSSDRIPSLMVQNGRSLNFSKLVRNTYSYAGIPLCN